MASESKQPPSKVVSLLTAHTSAKTRLLFSSRGAKANLWTAGEEASLVQFIIDQGYRKDWPKSHHLSTSMWEEACVYLTRRGHKAKRASGSCRARVLVKLAKKFISPEEAQCGLSSLDENVSPAPTPASQEASLGSSASIHHMTPSLPSSTSIFAQDTLMDSFRLASHDDQLAFVGEAVSLVASQHFNIELPTSFVNYALEGMQNLQAAGRSNVIYGLCKGVGTSRKNNPDETMFPTSRMPMGMLEYMVEFFGNKSSYNVRCPSDYLCWLESMYCLFGTKWSKLFRGPCWSHDPTGQEALSTSGQGATYSPQEARVNVPSPSSRTLQSKIAESDFSVTTAIQQRTLDESHRLFPNARWWIKADGVDLIGTLEDSVRGEWNGDVDTDDGELQQLRSEYLARIDGVPSMNQPLSTSQVEELIRVVESDLELVSKFLQTATREYESKLESNSGDSKALHSLGWKSRELSELNTDGRHIITELNVLLDTLHGSPTADVANKIHKIGKALTTFIKAVYRHRRTAATHMLAVLISTEDRKCKPYALPVQMIAYTGMSHEKLRKILNKLVQRMTTMGMVVVGFVSNGEHNQLRVKGYTRPVSVLNIKATVRAKYSRMSLVKLKKLIVPRDGSVSAEDSQSPVPHDVLKEVSSLLTNGVDLEDVVDRLRCRTVPSGYTFHTWRQDEDEDLSDKLRAILSQFEFCNTVKSWDAKGVSFCTRLYVPEVHPITNAIFHEREDEGHVFKRIGQCTRRGGPDSMKLERFTEALFDKSTHLTYPALTGQRKQSIRDVEILFSEKVERFMEAKGYRFETRFIKAVRHWRVACDMRGLSALKRCQYNYELLNLLLSELMPWYGSMYDFSTMEVTRPVAGVLGFTRQVVNAVTTNIETREWRRCQFPDPENPRASTTDDVECLFSILRDMVGKHFTLHVVKYNWRQLCIEFSKRMDPSLPFYYYTSSHDRFYEGDMPSFDVPSTSKQNPRNRPTRRVERLSGMQGRVTLPKPGDISTRSKYHNVPVEHPPPPSLMTPLIDHNYS